MYSASASGMLKSGISAAAKVQKVKQVSVHRAVSGSMSGVLEAVSMCRDLQTHISCTPCSRTVAHRHRQTALFAHHAEPMANRQPAG